MYDHAIPVNIIVGLTVYDQGPSTRRRLLDHWSVTSMPAKTPGITIFRVEGQTIQENVDTPEAWRPGLRLSQTSPIVELVHDGVARCGVRTATGSIYWLGPSGKNTIEEIKAAVDANNTWLQGDNWMTI